ncbi:MAG: VOC family protein [Robiginitomaculum sp.]|nr:VOC family protein [Robiginitomaculum sp.]
MIGYQMVGTNKFDESAAFYDALLGEMGAKRMMEDEGRFIAWAVKPGQPAFSICRPHDGKDATVGNGGMTAFIADTPETVDKLYAKAIELGATCEGPAGARGDGSFYAGYFRDPDGNKCNFFWMGAPSS